MKLISHPWLAVMARYLLGIIVGLTVTLLIVVANGEDPLHFVSVVTDASFANGTSALNWIRWTAPILLSAVAYIIPARAGIFNCGVEGEIIVGALCAAIVGAAIPFGGLPGLIITALAGAIFGMLYALIPALLFVYYRVSEIVTTLMLNYIAVLLCNLTVRQFFLARNADGSESITVTSTPVRRDIMFGLFTPGSSANWSIAVVAVITVVAGVWMLKTRTGYELSAVGESPGYARHIGVNFQRTQLRAFLLSGLIAGLVGSFEVQGVLSQYIDGAFTNMGWNGLLAGVIAMNNPIGTVAASLFLGLLENSKLAVAQFTGVSPYMIQFLAATLILVFAIDPARKLISDLKRRIVRHAHK